MFVLQLLQKFWKSPTVCELCMPHWEINVFKIGGDLQMIESTISLLKLACLKSRAEHQKCCLKKGEDRGRSPHTAVVRLVLCPPVLLIIKNILVPENFKISRLPNFRYFNVEFCRFKRGTIYWNKRDGEYRTKRNTVEWWLLQIALSRWIWHLRAG